MCYVDFSAVKNFFVGIFKPSTEYHLLYSTDTYPNWRRGKCYMIMSKSAGQCTRPQWISKFNVFDADTGTLGDKYVNTITLATDTIHLGI